MDNYLSKFKNLQTSYDKEEAFELPDGSTVTFGKERFGYTSIYFGDLVSVHSPKYAHL